MPQLDAALGQTVAVPVDGLARLVVPQGHERLVDVAGGVQRGHRDVVELVDLGAPLLLIAGVHGAQVVADAHARGEAVDADDVGALLGRRRNGEHAARAAADHQDVGVVGRDNLVVGNLGLDTEPVGRRAQNGAVVRPDSRGLLAGSGFSLVSHAVFGGLVGPRDARRGNRPRGNRSAARNDEAPARKFHTSLLLGQHYQSPSRSTFNTYNYPVHRQLITFYASPP